MTSSIQAGSGGEMDTTHEGHFGMRMRTWRQEAGISIQDAADALDVDRNYLRRIETGGSAKRPTRETLRRAAELYKRPAVEVLESAGLAPDPDDRPTPTITRCDIEARLSYRKPDGAEVERMRQINDRVLDLGRALIDNMPQGADLIRAIDHLELVWMIANAGIIHRGGELAGSGQRWPSSVPGVAPAPAAGATTAALVPAPAAASTTTTTKRAA